MPDVGFGASVRGFASPGVWRTLLVCSLVASPAAFADPAGFIPTQTAVDPPPRSTTPAPILRPTWDLDGTYLWLGPVGAASLLDAKWDTAFGGDATVVRVREREAFAAIGASIGASRLTVRDGGQVWLDALIGTEVNGHMIGVSAGPILELAELDHPKVGGSIGIWGFVGVAPYVRVGAVDTLGTFAEFGIHIALPVLRR